MHINCKKRGKFWPVLLGEDQNEGPQRGRERALTCLLMNTPILPRRIADFRQLDSIPRDLGQQEGPRVAHTFCKSIDIDDYMRTST